MYIVFKLRLLLFYWSPVLQTVDLWIHTLPSVCLSVCPSVTRISLRRRLVGLWNFAYHNTKKRTRPFFDWVSISRTINFFGPTDEVRSYGFALVRPSVRLSVCPSVRPSGRFHSNGSLEFSDFWYQGSFLLLLKTDGARFSKKNFFWPKMAK